MVITFNNEITFSSVIIGARKAADEWNHSRYQSVQVLVDGQEVAKTSSTFRLPDDYKIVIPIPHVKGTSLELIHVGPSLFNPRALVRPICTFRDNF